MVNTHFLELDEKVKNTHVHPTNNTEPGFLFIARDLILAGSSVYLTKDSHVRNWNPSTYYWAVPEDAVSNTKYIAVSSAKPGEMTSIIPVKVYTENTSTRVKKETSPKYLRREHLGVHLLLLKRTGAGYAIMFDDSIEKECATLKDAHSTYSMWLKALREVYL